MVAYAVCVPEAQHARQGNASSLQIHFHTVVHAVDSAMRVGVKATTLGTVTMEKFRAQTVRPLLLEAAAAGTVLKITMTVYLNRNVAAA